MALYMGFDGGGTKTKCMLCDEHGMILAENTQPTSHYLQCGFDGLKKVLNDGCEALLKDAKRAKADVVAVFVACAGYGDIEEDNESIEKSVRCVFPNILLGIGNDTDNALAGALAGEYGINIIAGTGSIALGKDQSGNSVRSGGWHHAFGGDEGSAYWIACKLIQHFSKQADDREPKTKLYSYMKQKFGFAKDSDMLKTFVVEWNFDRTRIASICTCASELARMKDDVVLSIFDEAAKELADIILAVVKQLHFSGSIPVSYTGGVFKSGSYILDPLKKYLVNDKNINLIPPILEPDTGSIILAMQLHHLNINDQIIHNLQTRNTQHKA